MLSHLLAFSQDQSGRSTGCSHCPALANPNVVSSPPTTFVRPALDPAPTTRPSTTPLLQWPTSTTKESSSDGSYEADAEISFILKHGHAEIVISEDSDLLAYGCKKASSRDMYVQLYRFPSLFNVFISYFHNDYIFIISLDKKLICKHAFLHMHECKHTQ